MLTIPKKIIDNTTDVIDKVSSPSSRSGSIVERVAKMLTNGVNPNVIALQMTNNSPNEQTYTEKDVNTLAKVYLDSKTKVVITAKQTTALIKDQKQAKAPANAIPQS